MNLLDYLTKQKDRRDELVMRHRRSVDSSHLANAVVQFLRRNSQLDATKIREELSSPGLTPAERMELESIERELYFLDNSRPVHWEDVTYISKRIFSIVE